MDGSLPSTFSIRSDSDRTAAVISSESLRTRIWRIHSPLDSIWNAPAATKAMRSPRTPSLRLRLDVIQRELPLVQDFAIGLPVAASLRRFLGAGSAACM